MAPDVLHGDLLITFCSTIWIVVYHKDWTCKLVTVMTFLTCVEGILNMIKI